VLREHPDPMRASSLAAVLGLAVLLLAPSARAQQPKHKGAADLAAPMAIPLPPDAIKRLKSGDPAQVKSALDDVRVSGRAGAAAVPAVVDLLKQGLPAALAQAAIETLGETATEAASDILGWYSRDRDVALRRASVEALAKTHGANAVKALRAALSDPDPGVRGGAATALGDLKAREAVADLFAALDHKVEEAAASIGQLCDPGDCERLAAKLGYVPFDVMTGGLDQILLRGTKDVDDDTKIKIVGRVRELGTGEANQFLKDVQTKWPAKSSPRVKQAIDQAVIATSSSPGSAAPESAP
jgi:HEAT repeat protein